LIKVYGLYSHQSTAILGLRKIKIQTRYNFRVQIEKSLLKIIEFSFLTPRLPNQAISKSNVLHHFVLNNIKTKDNETEVSNWFKILAGKINSSKRWL